MFLYANDCGSNDALACEGASNWACFRKYVKIQAAAITCQTWMKIGVFQRCASVVGAQAAKAGWFSACRQKWCSLCHLEREPRKVEWQIERCVRFQCLHDNIITSLGDNLLHWLLLLASRCDTYTREWLRIGRSVAFGTYPLTIAQQMAVQKNETIEHCCMCCNHR